MESGSSTAPPFTMRTLELPSSEYVIPYKIGATADGNQVVLWSWFRGTVGIGMVRLSTGEFRWLAKSTYPGRDYCRISDVVAIFPWRESDIAILQCGNVQIETGQIVSGTNFTVLETSVAAASNTNLLQFGSNLMDPVAVTTWRFPKDDNCHVVIAWYVTEVSPVIQLQGNIVLQAGNCKFGRKQLVFPIAHVSDGEDGCEYCQFIRSFSTSSGIVIVVAVPKSFGQVALQTMFVAWEDWEATDGDEDYEIPIVDCVRLHCDVKHLCDFDVGTDGTVAILIESDALLKAYVIRVGSDGKFDADFSNRIELNSFSKGTVQVKVADSPIGHETVWAARIIVCGFETDKSSFMHVIEFSR